jgi:cytoskeletal protein RodZ
VWPNFSIIKRKEIKVAKGPTLSTITNILNSSTILNSNFTAITTAFNNTISRDGSTPNQMEADFDMNSNDILNAGSVSTTTLIVDGTNLNSQVTNAAASATAAAASATIADTKAGEAAASAANAALYDHAPVASDLAALKATTSTYTAGEYLQVAFGGTVLKAVDSGGTITNAGSQQFVVVVNPRFTDRDATTAAELASYPNNTEGKLDE